MPDARGRFLGIEFREAVGTNDGSLEGKQYFKTKPQFGLFVKPERCTWRGMKVTEEMLP
jgi:dynactin complex subunit